MLDKAPSTSTTSETDRCKISWVTSAWRVKTTRSMMRTVELTAFSFYPTTSHLPWDRDEVQQQHQLPLQQRRGESNSCDRPFGASSHNIFVSSSDSTTASKCFRQQHPTTLQLCRSSTPTSSVSGGDVLESSNDSSTPSETAPCNFLQQVDTRITQPSRDSQQYRKHPGYYKWSIVRHVCAHRPIALTARPTAS